MSPHPSERNVICPFQADEGNCLHQFRSLQCIPHPRIPECVKKARVRALGLAGSFPMRSDLTELYNASYDDRYGHLEKYFHPEFIDQFDRNIEFDATSLGVDPELYRNGIIDGALTLIREIPTYRSGLGYIFPVE
ncbi:MAG: hypothetical protein AAB874_02015 [Patescibacteria group bacterium]